MHDAAWIRAHSPLTHGQARLGARRLRRLGFSPVTIHRIEADPALGLPAGYHLRCNWPYSAEDLPDDLYTFLSDSAGDSDGDHEGTRIYDAVQWPETWGAVCRLIERYSTVRLGMGARPIRSSRRRQDPIGYEASMVPTGRITYDIDDWPRGRRDTQQHPDWERFLRDNRGDSPSQPGSGDAASAVPRKASQRFACPCCGYYTLPKPPPGTHYICPVCFWDDDILPPYSKGGANGISLYEARRNFAAWGYSKEHIKDYVRPPQPEEFPPARTNLPFPEFSTVRVVKLLRRWRHYSGTTGVCRPPEVGDTGLIAYVYDTVDLATPYIVELMTGRAIRCGWPTSWPTNWNCAVNGTRSSPRHALVSQIP